MILGLRRTLGFQMAALALSANPFPRLAAAALLVLFIALGARTLLWLRRAAWIPAYELFERNHGFTSGATAMAAWPRAVGSWLIVGGWVLLIWAPVGGLVRLALLISASRDIGQQKSLWQGAEVLLERLSVAPAPALWARSLLLLVGLTACIWVLSRRLARDVHSDRQQAWRRFFRLEALPLPAVVAGAAVLAVGRTAVLASRFLAVQWRWPLAEGAMEQVALALDPLEFPGLVLFLGICLAYLPQRLGLRRDPRREKETRGHRFEQMRLAGANRLSTAWHVWMRNLPVPFATMVLWSTLAATSITPALVLTPAASARSIGAGIVGLAGLPGDSRSQAAALALAVIALNLLALSWAQTRDRRSGVLQAVELIC
jgi:iron(III) transport system permease protein